MLWELTKHLLAREKARSGKQTGALVDDAALRITLPHPPARDIPPGVYSLKGEAGYEHLYYPETPLAKWAINTACSLATPPVELVFGLTDSGKNISILQELVGHSGILAVKRLTLNALQSEDYFLLAGLTDTGELLDAEQTRRLFDLPATQGITAADKCPASSPLEPHFEAQRKKIVDDVAARDAMFFEEEMDKLDRWAEDSKKQLELEIGEMDRVIKEHKAEARKTANLEGKVNLQRKIKTLEAKRLDMRKRLFEAQDQVDGQKDALLNDIETRMRQQIEEKELFCVAWRLV